jgi:CheY-like chemotaxis protein
MATLEALVTDPGRLAAAPDLRVALYRQLLKTQASTAAGTPVGETGEAAQGARRRLDSISLRPRIAFLLHALEGFDAAQVGAILGVAETEANELLRAANDEIADQIATDVLIIEDEPFIAHDLRSIVEELGHRVCGMARTHGEAIAAIGDAKPGLILADIQLADGSSGLEAVNEILDSLSTPVIFITAYPERFLTGAPPEPAFLITKPFSVDSLKAVISQALFFDRRSRPREA